MRSEGIILESISDSYVKGERSFTQANLSRTTGVSVSAVNKTVNELKRIAAADVGRRSFSVIDFQKLLLYWATHRNLDKDIVYSTSVGMDVSRIESTMPPGIAFTAFTAYKFLVGEPPADYGEVYVYAGTDAMNIITDRFPPKKGVKNLFVLKADSFLERRIKNKELAASCVGLPRVFADLWNIRAWYAKEFTNRLLSALVK